MYVSAILGALPNWTAAPGVTITAGSEAVGCPAAHLTDGDDLGAAWRSAGLSPMVDTFLQVDLGQPRPVSSCYLVRHAHRPGDSWRLRGADAAIATAPRRAPTQLQVVAGNVFGDLAAIDDAVDTHSADALELTGPGKLRVTFEAVGAALAGGPASQLLRLRLAVIGATAADPLALAVSLVTETGVENLGIYQWTSPAETVLEVPFADSLDPAGPLLVELETTGGGSLLLVAIEWRPETVADAVPTDTGWAPLVLEPALALRYLEVGELPEELLRLTTAHHLIDGGQVIERQHRHWRVDLRAPEHPRGYVRAGLLALGPAWPFALTQDFRAPRIVDTSTTVRTADGSVYTRLGPTYTEGTLPLEAGSLEGPRDLLALRRFVGVGGRFGVSLLPEEPAAPALSYWAHLAEGGGPEHQPGQMSGDDRAYWWRESLEAHEV